jgi:hypothetical protein
MSLDSYAHRPTGLLKLLEIVENVYARFGKTANTAALSSLDVEGHYSWRDSRNWGRNVLSLRYLRGEGVQVAARSMPLPMFWNSRVQYVDACDTRELRWRCPELASKPLVDPQILDNIQYLSKIEDGSLDFIIALDRIEKSENPALLIETYLGKLRTKGVLYLSVHDKSRTIHKRRPSTSIEHVRRDYECDYSREREVHLEEWLRLVGGITDERELVHAISRLEESEYELAYHVWGAREFRELLQYLRTELFMPFEVTTSIVWPAGSSEILYILKKIEV